MAKRKKQLDSQKNTKSATGRNFIIIAYSNQSDVASISDHIKALEDLNAKDQLLFLPRIARVPDSFKGKKLKTSIPSEWRPVIGRDDNFPLLLVDLDSLDSDQILNNFNKIKGPFKKKSRCLLITGKNGESTAEMALIRLGELDKINFEALINSPLESLQQFYTLNHPDAVYRLDKSSGSIANQKIGLISRFSAFIQWFIKIPIACFKAGGALRGSNSPGYRLLFLTMAVFSFFLITHLSQNAAISGDEYRYIDQASRVYDYYATFGKDKAAVSQTGIDPQHYNSQSFDNMLYAVQKWMGLEADTFGFRHFWNAVVGWLAMLLAALIALKIGGYRMALITFIFLFLSPRFLGHSYNNHRDIPMAAAVVFSVWVMIPFLKSLPKIKWKYFLWVVLGIAWAYSLRLGGGVLVMGYLLAFAGLAYLVQSGSISGAIKNIGIGVSMLAYSVFACLAGFALGVLSWPYALEGPVSNSLEVLRASAELGVSLRQVFEGEQIWSNAMPWYYTGKWMLMTIPVFILLAFGFSFFTAKKILDRRNLLPWLMVLTAVVLPIIYALGFVNTHYGGWRHFIFVYPFIAILAAMGMEGFFRILENFKFKNFLWIAIPLFMLQPILFIVKNHPFEYMYFNEWMGGTKGAHGYFETDYSVNSLKEASEWLIENVIRGYNGEEPLIVATNDRRPSLYYFREFGDKVRVVYTRYYEKSRTDWDYATFYCALIHPHQIRAGYWPPKETIHKVLVDGVPVGAVVKRISKDDLKGYEALEEGRLEEAYHYFVNYLEMNPESEEIWAALAQLQSQSGQWEAAMVSASRTLELMPGNAQAITIVIQNYLSERDFENALKYAEEMIISAPNHFAGFYFKGMALKELNRIPEAIEAAEAALMRNNSFRGTYQLLAECYMLIGDRDMAERVLRFMEQQTN